VRLGRFSPVAGALLTLACVRHQQSGPSVLKAVPPGQRVAFTDVAFFDGAVYAASTAGLLEFRDGRLKSCLQWNPKDPVIESLWVSPDGKELWLKPAAGLSLTRLSDGRWESTAIPSPKAGYYTRGDALEGFRGIGDDHDWWLVGGGHAWRRDGQGRSWVDERVPSSGRLLGFARVSGLTFALVRHELLPMLGSDRSDFQSDTVEARDPEWRAIPQPGIRFLASYPTKSVAVTPGAMFIRTEKGELLRATSRVLEKVPAPGGCDAMTATTNGELLGSFGDQGVAVLREHWIRLFDRPDSAEWKTWGFREVSISEHGGAIAWAAYVGSAPGSLWIWREQVLTRLWPSP
jgi:hypothetical protein